MTFCFFACGGYNSPSSSGSGTSGLTTRALVSNLTLPGVYIIDYSKDVFSRKHPVIGISNPAFLFLSADKKVTLSYGLLDNTVTAIDNATESASNGVVLPGATASLAVSPDDSSAYAAVPTATVFGQSPGVIQVLTLGTSFAPSLKSTVPIPGVAWISLSSNGNRLVALSSVSNTVYIVDTSLIGVADPSTISTAIQDPSFDHPVASFVASDNATAYVLSCGPECGGSQASVTQIDLNTNSVTKSVPVPSATAGIISGTTMYVAGTAPGTPCTGQMTAATSCGQLTIVDLSAMSVVSTGLVTDGYHDRIAIAGNNQVFLGARACSQVNVSGGEQRGCLSIVDPANLSSAVFPPDQGDVTGIAAIPNRHVVYVIQGGELRMYDTTTDKVQTTQLDVVGQGTDVKIIN